MDAVSYAHSAKQAQRIEKFIKNPDSNSGIVTVPKVIATGETVTIPEGRVAILPNVQVDGTLNIEGEVFIPSGATFGDLETKLALKAPLSSPAFTGTPTAPTLTAQDNSTKLATTAYVDGKMVLGTAIASTSGTSIDFTGIPSWAKKITVMFNGVSTNGTSGIVVQVGNGTIQTTGYSSSSSSFVNGASPSVSLLFSNGFVIYDDNVSDLTTLTMEICLFDGNKYISVHSGMANGSTRTASKNGSGRVTLSGPLDRLRITNNDGTSVFDAGQINIMYEG